MISVEPTRCYKQTEKTRNRLINRLKSLLLHQTSIRPGLELIVSLKYFVREQEATIIMNLRHLPIILVL